MKKIKFIGLFVLFWILIAAGVSEATLVAYTGFEEVIGSNSVYTGNLTSPGWLPNRADEMVVEYLLPVNELGFRTYYNGTDGPVWGTADSGDLIGVYDSGHSGNNSFALQDTDPECRLVLDAMSLVDWSDVNVTLWFKLMDTDYTSAGPEGRMAAWVDTDEGRFYIFDMDTTELNLHSKDSWTLYSVNIPNSATTATLNWLVHVPGSRQGAQLDDIQFTGTTIPEPATVILLGLGSIALLPRGRQK